MSLITTKSNRIVLKKASSMMVVPYVYNSTYGWVLGSDVYDLSAIIGDSITIEQEDGNTTTKENEFVSSPLIECVSGAKYGFTAQCIDLQNAVLKSCFNVMSVNNVNGAIAFHDDHILMYAMIRVRFADSGTPDVFLPKVQLNSKLLVSQLKTRMSQGNIVGTAMSAYVVVANSTTTQALQFRENSNNETTYSPYTPVFFAPKSNNALFFHHKRGSGDVYTKVNFEGGTVSTDYGLDSANGLISVL